MCRPPQLVRVRVTAALLLVAVGCVAVADAVATKLQEACSAVQNDVTCTCSPEHPEIFFVSGDMDFLMGKRLLTIEHCSKVTLAGDTLRYTKTSRLQELRVQNVTYLELQLVLPKSLRTLVLSDIRELSPIPSSVFQIIEEMEKLTIQNVLFMAVEPFFLHEISLDSTEITGCRFPNLEKDSLYIKSQQVLMKQNSFTMLSTDALTVQSKTTFMVDNYFAALDRGSIQFRQWVQGDASKLEFQRNTFLLVEPGALSGLQTNGGSTMLSDNVLLCPDEYKTCKERMAVDGDQPACDAKDVCLYRKRIALTELLAAGRGCTADQPVSTERCAFLIVAKESNNLSGAACLQAPPFITVAVSLLAITWFTA